MDHYLKDSSGCFQVSLKLGVVVVRTFSLSAWETNAGRVEVRGPQDSPERLCLGVWGEGVCVCVVPHVILGKFIRQHIGPHPLALVYSVNTDQPFSTRQVLGLNKELPCPWAANAGVSAPAATSLGRPLLGFDFRALHKHTL